MSREFVQGFPSHRYVVLGGTHFSEGLVVAIWHENTIPLKILGASWQRGYRSIYGAFEQMDLTSITIAQHRFRRDC